MLKIDIPFSEVLKEYRKKTGKTQEETAVILGISNRMYQYYEKGDYDGTPERTRKYIEMLSRNDEGNVLKEPASHYGKNKGTPVYDLEATAGNIEITDHIPETIKGYINM